MSQESDVPHPPHQPTRELLLAQALDACIRAERQVPGSADWIIAHQPAWARTELRRLVALAGSLDAAATNAVMSAEFREAARARLLQRIRGEPETAAGAELYTTSARLSSVLPVNGQRVVRGRRSKWLWRGVLGGLLAAAMAIAATLTASAKSLPGEPLYGLKQVGEELGLRLAQDDQARAVALLRQADARLDETARLLKEGRTNEVTKTTQRFDEMIDRATTTLLVTIADPQTEGPTSTQLESKLGQQQEQLEAMLRIAPEPARADLREALGMTERKRALFADPHVVDRSISGGTAMKSAVARPIRAAAAVSNDDASSKGGR